MSSLIYLDEANVRSTANGLIDDLLVEALQILMSSFKEKTLGQTYSEVFAYLEEAPHQTLATIDLSLFPANKLNALGLTPQISLSLVNSLGDGMCGQHSLFIPTDGPLSTPEGGIAEGNGRQKMYSAIADNASDAITKRLYLLSSQHMDGTRFSILMQSVIGKLEEQNPEKAVTLKERVAAYDQFKADKQEESEGRVNQAKKHMLETILGLPEVEESLSLLQTKVRDPEQLKELALNGEFLNIIDAIINLKDINPELGRLMDTIKDDLLRLNAEIEEEKRTAIEKVNEDKKAIKQKHDQALAEFQEYKKENQQLVSELAVLTARQQQFQNLVQRKQIQGDPQQIQENINKQFKTRVMDWVRRNHGI